MKKNNKKGFTIVELVIVIAVIAILAAVLIPTFSSVIKQANLSNDKSFVRNANTTLATEKALSDDFAYAGDAILALNKNGFTGKYNAYSSGHHYAYHAESNKMYLVDDTNAVVYPDANVAVADLWFLWSNKAVDKVSGATKYISLVNITGGYYATHFDDGANYTIDLFGNVMSSDTNLANVTVINGVLNSGATGGNGVVNMEEGSAVVNGTAANPTVIENKYFTAADAINGKKNVTFRNCYFYGIKTSGIGLTNVTFDSCVFKSSLTNGYIFNVQGDASLASGNYQGTLTVKDCQFIDCARVFNIPVYVLGETNPGSIVITGNTFEGVTESARGVIQLQSQKISQTTSTYKGYVNITISGNKFDAMGSSQAGLIILHETLIKVEGLSDATIAFSNNTIDASISTDKYVVNDDGKADSAFNPYNIAAYKTALTNKFVASKN